MHHHLPRTKGETHSDHLKQMRGGRMQVQKLGVIGAGTMGNGIALLAAQIGYNVVMRDIKDEFVERGLKNIDSFLLKSIERGKLKADQKDAIVGRIKGTTAMTDLKDVDFVIEAVIEDQ